MRLRDALYIAGGMAAGAAGAALAHKLATERWQLTLTRALYAIRNLPPDLEGLTLAHLSDFHVGPFTPVEFVAEAVRLANQHKPDIVVLTGDYLDEDDTNLTECAAALGEISAPLGVYAVLGNHDYDVGADEVEQALSDAGITMLRNQSVALGEGERHLWIVGLDETATHREEFTLAFDGVPDDEPVILLSHSPDVLHRASDLGVELVLAGHTHGGQVRLPGLGAPHAPVRVSPRYSMGSSRNGHTRLYVTRGVGMTTIAVRFNCPPEIGLFTLCSTLR